MKNLARRFSREEYTLLLDALRTHEGHLEVMKELRPEDSHAGEVIKTFGQKFFSTLQQMYEDDKKRIHILRDRVRDLFHHDVRWLGETEPTWCLACKTRHEPHCAKCAACLPDNLPE